ncbi:MAG TPA: HNH endonuclease [Actinomycetota bacterium]|nr:HNH endonuclease [Actinomycetota bacterium]
MCSLIEATDRAHEDHVRALAQLLSCISDLGATDAWKDDGAGDLSSWIAARYQLGPRTARELVAQARTVHERPALQEAMSLGRISTDQVKAVGVLSAPGPDDAAAWVGALPFWSIGELEHEARKETARRLERSDNGRYLRLDVTRDERFMRIRGQLHPEEGALVQKALDRRVPKETHLRDFDAAYADALVDIASSAVAQDGDPDRATVVVHVEKPVLPAAADAPAPVSRPADDRTAPAWVESDAFVPHEVALRLCCDARLDVSATDPSSGSMRTGRVARTVPPHLYRRLRRRDKTCVFPGCDRKRRVHAHHIIHWSSGGPTTLDNLILLCTTHHVLVHEGRWSLRGEAGPGISFTRPDGSVFQPRTQALRAPRVRSVVPAAMVASAAASPRAGPPDTS